MPARLRTLSGAGLLALGFLILGLLGAGCTAESPEPSEPLRSTRFGIFRDLVLVQRPTREGGPFFFDRFETTIADWSVYQRTEGGWTPVDPAVLTDTGPKAQVSLREARRYASWRFCRLPREAEWDYVATQGGTTKYPWGHQWFEPRANTHGLNLKRVTKVGSFETGKTPTGIYDLVGNVAEWTETVDLYRERPDEPGAFLYELPGEFAVSQAPGLHCWLMPGTPVPLEWLVMADYGDVPRKVLGGSFYTSVSRSAFSSSPPFPEPVAWLPDRRDANTGVRLAAGPVDLLRSLVVSRVAPSAVERAGLLEFLRRPGHPDVLRRAWRWLLRGDDLQEWRSSAMYILLDAELSR